MWSVAWVRLVVLGLILVVAPLRSHAAEAIEVSEDGLWRVESAAGEAPSAWMRGDDVPFPLTPDWSNTSGAMAISWTSTASYHGHADLRWEDVDLDGDPDLAEVHSSNGQAHIYLNRDGVLDSSPSWTFDSPHAGTAIAFGDINGGGLPDLVVGNSGDTSIWVFHNDGVPPIFVDDFESGNTGAWSAVNGGF